MPNTKINIEVVYEAFQTYANDQLRNSMENVNHPRLLMEQSELNRETLKRKLGPLADMIDWTDLSS
jgi:hypothetical protein